MINFEKSADGECRLSIGKKTVILTTTEAAGLADLLTEKEVERIADSQTPSSSGAVSLSGALDEEKERGRDLSYRRILLEADGRSWHLKRSEAVILGSRIREVIQTV